MREGTLFFLFPVFRFQVNRMAFSFEKLIVYQKAIDFADDVCAETAEFTRGFGFHAT